MKNLFSLITIVSLFIGCATTDIATKKDITVKDEAFASAESSETLFSKGIFYKNLAANSTNTEEKNKNIDLAMENFNAALKDSSSKERIYLHIAELFYMKGEINKSEEYCLLSIKENNTFFPPYSRLYSIYMGTKKLSKATEILSKYLEIVPDDQTALYMMGIHYYKYLNDKEKSISCFEKIISISKKLEVQPYYMENSFYNIGYILYEKGEFKKSFFNFLKARDINESNTSTIYMLALSAFGYYNIKDALNYSQMYLKLFPKEQNMLYIAGSCYYINDDTNALHYLLMAKNSKTFEGLLSSGLYLELTGDYKNAENILKAVSNYRNNMVTVQIGLAKIKTIHGKEDEAYNALVSAGTTCFRNGLFPTAERLFYQAMMINNQNKEIYYYLARAHEENKNYAMAISYYQKYYQLSGENDILVHIGYLYGIQKNYTKAEEFLARAIEKLPENPGPYFFRGLINIWGENYVKAKENISIAINKKNDEETFFFYLAFVNEKLGQYEEAEENLRDAIRVNPESARSMNFLAYLFAEKNINLEEAFTLVTKALDIEPGNSAYLDTLGWIYYQKGNYEKALMYLLEAEEKINEIENPDFVIYEHIGDTYLKLGNQNMAKFYYEKGLKIEKNERLEKKLKLLKNGDNHVAK